jgi:hypothetical protein
VTGQTEALLVGGRVATDGLTVADIAAEVISLTAWT